MKTILIASAMFLTLLLAQPVGAEVTSITLNSHECAMDVTTYPNAVAAICQLEDYLGFVAIRLKVDETPPWDSLPVCTLDGKHCETVAEFNKRNTKDCLAQMEQAMRAMEPYSVVERQLRFINIMGRSILEIYLEDKPIPDKPGLYEASKQWTAAKACWRAP